MPIFHPKSVGWLLPSIFTLGYTRHLRQDDGVRKLIHEPCPPQPIYPTWFPDNVAYRKEADAFKYYMQPGSCLGERRSVAAAVMAAKNCKRIADVGGLLLRLIDHPLFPHAAELYVNIDPASVYRAGRVVPVGVEHMRQPTCELNLPMTTQQFAALPVQTRDSFRFDCVAVLGAMPAQFVGEAMRMVMQNASLLIIDEAMTEDPSSPCKNCGSLRGVQPLLGDLGFSQDSMKLSELGRFPGNWHEGVSPLCSAFLKRGALLDCRNSTDLAMQDRNLLLRQIAIYSKNKL